MSAYKYLGIFSRQMEAIAHFFAIHLFICSFSYLTGYIFWIPLSAVE